MKATPDGDAAICRRHRPFPNVTVVRIRDAIATAADVLGNIGLASRVIFLSILAGVLVLAGHHAGDPAAAACTGRGDEVLGATRRAHRRHRGAWEFASAWRPPLAALSIGTLAGPGWSSIA